MKSIALFMFLQLLIVNVALPQETSHGEKRANGRLLPRDDPVLLIPGAEPPSDIVQTDVIGTESNSTGRRLQETNLHFRSAQRNITTVNGIELHSPPILTTHLRTLLEGARKDLKAVKQVNSDTLHYHWNSSEWSWNFIAPKERVSYTAILAIVAKLIRQIPSDTSYNVTWARLGRLDRGDIPIADCLFIPSNSADTFIAGAPQENQTLTEEVIVRIITPTTITNTTEIVNSSALAFYNTSPLPKRQMPDEIMIRIANSVWALGVRLWRNPNDEVIEMGVNLAICAMFVGLAQYAIILSLHHVLGTVLADAVTDIYGMHSGAFRLGRMIARFSMQLTMTDEHGVLVRVNPDVWKKLAYAIIARLQQHRSGSAKTYAVEGEIFGPNIANGTNEQVVAGRWELIAEPAVDHDEL
ncbi:MAG: hypothetical protein LQ342_005539 [Letrouitia transgressa]|nr:MAG: hypothetical protein LQ342_005539 [Letrouitia transgressa]